MIGQLIRLSVLFGLGFAGYWMGSHGLKPKGWTQETLLTVQPVQNKQFVLVVYGKDDAAWCERTLRSIFEQDYDAYRLIVIDDGSVDDTFEKVQRFVEENRQEDRTILIQNAIPMGFAASLKRAAEQCFDCEMMFPISARDWLVHPGVLSLANLALQKKGTNALLMNGIRYPDYSLISMKDGIGAARFFRSLSPDQSYIKTLHKAKNQEKILDPLVFHNETLARSDL